MSFVTSADGARIAVHVDGAGAGQPLLLVHGGFVDSGHWARLAPLLATRHEVWRMDRRGHGQSDSYAAGHTIEREFEDVAAVLAAIGRPVVLMGHSAGAHVALNAALRSPHMSRLILYEPPVLGPDTNPTPPDEIVNDAHALALFAVREVVDGATGEMKPPEAYAGLLKSSFGAMLQRNALSFPAELKSYRAYAFEPRNYAALSVPTLLLVGETSPPFNRIVIDQLHTVLPNSRIAMIPGQSHGAMMGAPAVLAEMIAA